MRRPTRPLAAVLCGLALLVLPAPPTGASTGTIGRGTLEIGLAPALAIDLAPGTGPCPEVPSRITSTVTATAPGGVHLTVTITDLPFTYAGSTYFLSGISVDGRGAFEPSATRFTVGPLASTVGNVYAETRPGACVPGDAACAAATLDTRRVPMDLRGSFLGGHLFDPPALLGDAVMSGSGEVRAIGCSSRFAALDGSALSLTDMKLSFA